MSDAPAEWLFPTARSAAGGCAVGDLQAPAGEASYRLPGFRLAEVRITDPQVLAGAARPSMPIASPSADPADAIEGTVFLVTPAELDDADRYEVADYTRMRRRWRSASRRWSTSAAGMWV